MQVPLQITYQNMPHSEALDARIRDKVAKLEHLHPHIMSCRVTVDELDRHHQRGKHFCVRLDVRVPQHEIAVNRDHDEDVYVALRDAFAAATRKLEDIVRLQRREVKAHEVPRLGTVVRLFPEDGCGFIAGADGNEYYFSRENVAEPSFEQLEVGVTVQFIEVLANEGRQAKRVTVGKHGSAAEAASAA
jgi:ribosome-associated translation inhibitor RaiA/cold shock CspA family protein